MTFLFFYYGTMFLFHEPLLAFGLGFLSVYVMYKVTLDKPEGQAFRILYRYVRLGKMIPGPRFAKRFEI